MMSYPKPLATLIQALRRLPGVGTRTAERYAFQLLGWPPTRRHELCQAITAVEDQLKACDSCGCLCDTAGCDFCATHRETAKSICVVASMRDVFAIEETGSYRGLYHVLGGLLSPIDQIDVDQIAVPTLLKRIRSLHLEEVILALDATLEGDTTALYIREQLSALPIRLSRLAFGLPLGSAFSYVDGGTLARALMGRNSF